VQHPLVAVGVGTQQQAEAQQVLPEIVHFPPTQQVLQSTQTQSFEHLVQQPVVAVVAGTQPQPEALQSPPN